MPHIRERFKRAPGSRAHAASRADAATADSIHRLLL
jgi:hypothetical protein